MLSRVAERVYWGARYIERAENTARLVMVHSNLLLDLPGEAGVGWGHLIATTGSNEAFARRFKRSDERTTVRYLLGDRENPGSIVSSLAAARENFRTTRDVVPTEGWRCVNELFLYVRSKFGRTISHRTRYEVLTTIIERCQQITGQLAGTMSHGNAYQFVRIGRNLERADMCTRIIDVAAATLLGRDLERYDNRLWMSVLLSISAYQMYRQYVRRRILANDVLEFLVEDTRFPRALRHCLGEVRTSLEILPRNDAPLRAVGRLERMIGEAGVAKLDPAAVHQLVDTLQVELADLHAQIAATWFTLSPTAE